MGIAVAVLSMLIAASPTGLVSKVGEVEVDHEQGRVVARAGSAADIRMPYPNAARPGAERRAQSAADASLREALLAWVKKEGELLGVAAVDLALAKAVTDRVEYQSNGGVFLWRRISFADLVGKAAPSNPPIPIAVPAMPARIRPSLLVAGQKVSPAYVIFRKGTPDKDALAAKWDKKGSLLTIASQEAGLREKLADTVLVIYVGKLEP